MIVTKNVVLKSCIFKKENYRVIFNLDTKEMFVEILQKDNLNKNYWRNCDIGSLSSQVIDCAFFDLIKYTAGNIKTPSVAWEGNLSELFETVNSESFDLKCRFVVNSKKKEYYLEQKSYDALNNVIWVEIESYSSKPNYRYIVNKHNFIQKFMLKLINDFKSCEKFMKSLNFELLK